MSAEVYPFINDMPALFARPILLLCRSGASTVAEITAAGKPAVFVPFPRAADDHQRVNAQALERAGAAVVLEETKLDASLAGRDPQRAVERTPAAAKNERSGAEAGASRRGARYRRDGGRAGRK